MNVKNIKILKKIYLFKLLVLHPRSLFSGVNISRCSQVLARPRSQAEQSYIYYPIYDILQQLQFNFAPWLQQLTLNNSNIIGWLYEFAIAVVKRVVRLIYEHNFKTVFFVLQRRSKQWLSPNQKIVWRILVINLKKNNHFTQETNLMIPIKLSDDPKNILDRNLILSVMISWFCSVQLSVRHVFGGSQKKMFDK